MEIGLFGLPLGREVQFQQLGSLEFDGVDIGEAEKVRCRVAFGARHASNGHGDPWGSADHDKEVSFLP